MVLYYLRRAREAVFTCGLATAPVKLIYVGKNVTFQCIRLKKKMWGSISAPSSGLGALLLFSWFQRFKEPTDAAQAAGELIDYSQEEADDLITQGEAQRDYKDSKSGYPPRMFDLGSFAPWRECPLVLLPGSGALRKRCEQLQHPQKPVCVLLCSDLT